MANLRIKKHETPIHRYYTPWDRDIFVTKIGRLQALTEAGQQFLLQSGEYCRMERAIIARLLADQPTTKSGLMAEFGFPGRMVNTAVIQAKGMIDSARECAKANLADATEAIGRKLSDYWEAAEAPAGDGEFQGRIQHLTKLVARETRAEAQVVRPSIFPGGRAYRDQAKNPGWKADYEAIRSDHIGCVGSSDEACGNSTLQITLGRSEMRQGKLWQWCNLTHAQQVLGEFRLRVDDNEELLRILQSNTAPKQLVEVDAWLDEQGRLIHPKAVERLKRDGKAPFATRKVMRTQTAGRTALNVMLHRHEDGRWYLHVSYAKAGLPESYAPEGWMGIDLNADSIAHACLSHAQVLLSYGKTPFPQGGPSGARATELYRQINALVLDAKERRLGISLEFLEFEGSKRWLKNKLGQTLRMFPYRQIRGMFEARCKLHGVPLRFVPPGYSSLLGALFSQKWPELGRDQAACVVLAARATEQGNRWLEELCESAAKAERITLRVNAKGLFGCNTTVMGPSPARSPRGHQMDRPRRSGTLSPLRWQLCCGKKISDVFETLRREYRDRMLAGRRAAVAQGRSKVIPRPKVPALLKLDPHEAFPRIDQLCAGLD